MAPRLARKLTGVFISFAVLATVLWFAFGRHASAPDAHETLRVMTYSSFMAAWGPGPELAKRFHEKTGIQVEFQDAGDAGLILEKLKLFPVDAVVGLDGLSLDLARKNQTWRELEQSGVESPSIIRPEDHFSNPPFVAVDWSPLAFVYRKGEIEPPKSLHDLLDKRFAGAIALEDPRTSTPGLQFLLWVLTSLQEDKGFEFLKALKPNLHSVSPSWSGAYGAFTKKQAKLVLSYQTSPIYHLLEEKDTGYAAADFTEGQPVQVEYAGIPSSCARCTDAEAFVQFLLQPEIQALIMRKNFMRPVISRAEDNTPFANLTKINAITLSPDFMSRRAELFEKWRKLGL